MEGVRFLIPGTGDFPVQQWIEEKLGIFTSFDGGWTAATCGAALATALGSPAVYLAGVDFATSGKEAYAKGVDLPKQGPSIPLEDGRHTRPDWLLAAEWLNNWALHHPEQTWGVVSKANPLMPAIPSAHLNSCAGPEGVSSFTTQLFASCKPTEGRWIWHELAESLSNCRRLIEQFLTHFETIFPKSPLEDGTSALLLHDLDEQLATQKIFNPIWAHWELVLKREPEHHPEALLLHRLLLFKSLCDTC